MAVHHFFYSSYTTYNINCISLIFSPLFIWLGNGFFCLPMNLMSVYTLLHGYANYIFCGRIEVCTRFFFSTNSSTNNKNVFNLVVLQLWVGHIVFHPHFRLKNLRKMPKEIFETTVERANGENWGLVVSGGKDMVNFTIILTITIIIIFTIILFTLIIKLVSFIWKIQRSSDWARTNVWENEISGVQLLG